MARVMLRRIPLILGTLLVTTSCMENMPGPGHNRPPPGMCPTNYQPVCAARGAHRRNFGNACEAQRRGYSVVREGRCGGRP